LRNHKIFTFFSENSLPSPNKSNPDEEIEFAPPNDAGNLVLLPERYPNDLCNLESLSVVHRIVIQSNLDLKIKYITLEDGYIKIEHLTNTTREYFQRTDENSLVIQLQTEIRINIKVLPYPYILKRILLSCILREPIESSDFLINFKRENGINTARCLVENNEQTTDGCEITFAVSPLCYKQIMDKGTQLRINQQAIEYNVVENPYPELFSVQSD
jgi:hypothetical protein